jgi:hypothetical protein
MHKNLNAFHRAEGIPTQFALHAALVGAAPELKKEEA